jgi:hypothetical protein
LSSSCSAISAGSAQRSICCQQMTPPGREVADARRESLRMQTQSQRVDRRCQQRRIDAIQQPRDRPVGAHQMPVPVDRQRGVGLVAAEHQPDRLAGRGKRGIVQRPLRKERREAGRQQQEIALAQRHLQLRAKVQDHHAARLRPASLDEAQMARRDVGLQGSRSGRGAGNGLNGTAGIGAWSSWYERGYGAAPKPAEPSKARPEDRLKRPDDLGVMDPLAPIPSHQALVPVPPPLAGVYTREELLADGGGQPVVAINVQVNSGAVLVVGAMRLDHERKIAEIRTSIISNVGSGGLAVRGVALGLRRRQNGPPRCSTASLITATSSRPATKAGASRTAPDPSSTQAASRASSSLRLRLRADHARAAAPPSQRGQFWAPHWSAPLGPDRLRFQN